MTQAGGNPPIRASEALLKKLAKIGLHSEADLLVHLPLRYEDETRITPVERAFGGEPVQVEVVVHSNELQFRPRRQMVVRAGRHGRHHAAFFQLLPEPAGGPERRLAHPGLWRGARWFLRGRDGASALPQGGR